jgi:hypothetical protein
MFNYLFPIFAFGLVITGIVFLGLQQAADLAKQLAPPRDERDNRTRPPETSASAKNADAKIAPVRFQPPTT